MHAADSQDHLLGESIAIVATVEVIGEASDGEEAVKMGLEKQPDVALMDIWMPRLSGIDATRHIGKRGLDTKVLVLSMHESRTYVEEVLRAGAAGYIVKNAASSDLLAAIGLHIAVLTPAVVVKEDDAFIRQLYLFL